MLVESAEDTFFDWLRVVSTVVAQTTGRTSWKTATSYVVDSKSKSVLFIYSTMLDERVSSKFISFTTVITGINNELTVAIQSCNYDYCISAISFTINYVLIILHLNGFRLFMNAITRSNLCNLGLIVLLL